MSTAQTTAVAVSEPQPQRAPVTVGRAGVQLTTLDDMWRFSTAVSKSGLAPKGIESPEAILIAVQMGMEVGLTPMAALQNIAVINGRPTIWGDAQLAVCRGSGELEEFSEWYEENGQKLPRNPTEFKDTTSAVCRVKRRGSEARETSFSVGDAKRANLWGKSGPWSQYPARMLRFRARSFGLRDEFGDALKGIRTTEEVIDDPIAFAAPANVTNVESKPIFHKPTPKSDAVAATVPETVKEAEPAQEGAEVESLISLLRSHIGRSKPAILEAELCITLAEMEGFTVDQNTPSDLAALATRVPASKVRSWVKGWGSVEKLHQQRVIKA